MKDPIDRLLATASQAPQKQPDAEPPLGLETRVIAAWRETLAPNENLGWWKLGGSFAATASLVMALSVAWNFHALRNLPLHASEPAELSMADSAVRLALNQ